MRDEKCEPTPAPKPKTPAPSVGLRLSRRVSGEVFLHGVAAAEFVVPKGGRLQVRRIRPDGAGDEPTHVVVFAEPAPNTKASDIERAMRDSAWWRRDPRHEGGEAP